VNYRIIEVAGWVVVCPSGKAENNEPLRVKYLFNRWLTREGLRVKPKHAAYSVTPECFNRGSSLNSAGFPLSHE
jgi:hypothetical protein